MDELFAAVERLAALLSGLDPERADTEQLGPALVRLAALRDRLDAARHRLTAEQARRTAWRDDGAASQKEWLREHCRLSAGAAAGQVRTAQQLAALPATAAALAHGSIGGAHVEVAARAARDLPDTALAGLDALVAQAGVTLDAAELRSAVDDYRQACAPESLEERDRRAWRHRRLTVTCTGDGAAVLDGRLDVVGGETVLSALAALSAPGDSSDTRTPEQRRADALVELAHRALDRGDLPEVGQVRPHVTVVVDLPVLAAAPLAGVGRAARLDRMGPVSGAAARRIACDASVTRVLTGPASQPLDVGRASRVVTVAQRRALAVRDRGCVGCGAPAAWAEAHHVRHWAAGGPTDLGNLILLCWRCHRDVHGGGRRAVREPSGRWVLRARPPP